VGELLEIWRELHVQEALWAKPKGAKEQIFHAYCTIGGKVRELIIDGRSCTNVDSTTLISKLQLPTKVHLTLILSNDSNKEVR